MKKDSSAKEIFRLGVFVRHTQWLRNEMYQILQIVRNIKQQQKDEKYLQHIVFFEMQIGKELAKMEVMLTELLVIIKQLMLGKCLVSREVSRNAYNYLSTGTQNLLLMKLNVQSILFL